MKKKIFISIFFCALLVGSSLFTGCDALSKLTNKVPENYTEGIRYSKDFEDDILEIYDDAVVYDEFNAFDEAVIICGSEDDFEDIVDFYKDFFEDNEITLLEEIEERDEYYARGIFEGYEFKVKIAEPDGEYVEDLFENIITLSTREIKESAAPSEPTPTQAIATAEPTAQPTGQINRPPEDANETRLTTLDEGIWSLYSEDNGLAGVYLEWTIYISDATSGYMFYADYEYGDRSWSNFTYSIDDGIITFTFDNGDKYSYFAYLDYEALHLVPYNDFSVNYYMYNYGQPYDEYGFSGYGDWMVYYADKDFLGTIAFWPDGTGYVYNWYRQGNDIYFTWEDSDGVVTFWDESGYELDSFHYSHKNDILEYYSTYDDYSPLFYNRTELNLLIGNYSLSYSNDPEMYDFNFELQDDYWATAVIQTSEGTFEDEYGYWYVGSFDGKLSLSIGDNYYSFNYHFYGSGLLLYNDETGYYYDLTYTQ